MPAALSSLKLTTSSIADGLAGGLVEEVQIVGVDEDSDLVARADARAG